MKMLRIFIVLLGIAFIFFFILPVFTYRILNIGNITGLLVGFLLFIYGIAFNVVNDTLKVTWRAGLFKWLMIPVMGIVIMCFLTAMIIGGMMVKTCMNKPKDDSTLVVLGCKVIGNSPSLMLRERLDAALLYLNEHPDAPCILSGGKGTDEDISEAQCMFDYLTANGIAGERLTMEDRSTSTRENIEYSNELRNSEGLGNSIAIVTNEFHEYRAAMIAKKLGVESYAYPAKTHWWLFPTYTVREMYGVIYEWIGLKR